MHTRYIDIHMGKTHIHTKLKTVIIIKLFKYTNKREGYFNTHMPLNSG